MKAQRGMRAHGPIKLALIATIAVGALGTAAYAHAAAGSSTDEGALKKRMKVRVQAQAWNPCDCPEYGQRSVSVVLNDDFILFRYRGQPQKGDGIYHKLKLLTDTICDASQRACNLWTKNHELTVDSRTGVQWDLYEDRFLSHHVTVHVSGHEFTEYGRAMDGDGFGPVYNAGDTAVAATCDASDAACKLLTNKHAVWIGGRP